MLSLWKKTPPKTKTTKQTPKIPPNPSNIIFRISALYLTWQQGGLLTCLEIDELIRLVYFAKKFMC